MLGQMVIDGCCPYISNTHASENAMDCGYNLLIS